ncbi:MAG: hypothetical protein ACTTKP_11040 [Catonella sp.]|uniref:hypothetical protein n=1 Tax=Catonella sp. TaxID=2382125 RepID=UPI003F9F4483
MNFKKTMIKGMAFAFTLGCIGFVAPKTVSAADFDFVLNLEKATTTKYKFWGVAKEVDEKKSDFTSDGKYYKVDEVTPVEGGTIDLSFLNKKNNNLIALGEVESFTAAGKPWIVKSINSQKTAFKADFIKLENDKVTVGGKEVTKAQTYSNGDLGAFAAVDGDSVLDITKPEVFKTIEVKLGKTCDWVQLNQFFGGAADAAPGEGIPSKVIAGLSQAGADVVVRLKGTDTAWASKEVKVKFTKQAKAPKITVDTAKGMINFKKGQEYKIGLNDAGAATIADDANWADISGKVAFKGGNLNLGIDGTKNALIQVRDKATAKKPASKITEIVLSKQEAVTVEELTKAGGLVTDKLDLVVKVPYDLKKGAYIENKTKVEYEIAIKNDGKVPDATTKWIKVKAGKDNKKKNEIIPSKTNLKYSTAKSDNTYGDDNSAAKIFVRLAGTKQDKVDGSVKLPSPDGEGKAFKLAADKGEFTKPDDALTVEGKIKSEIIKTEDIKFSKLFKDGVAPKITVTDKVSGVTVKASKMKKATDGTGSGKLTIKVSKSAFKAAPTNAPKLKFKILLEGVEKVVTVTLNITK